MKGFIGVDGRFYTGPQRMAMFSRSKMKRLLEDDPKELKVSDRIAAVMDYEPIPPVVMYERGGLKILTGSTVGGGVAHFNLTRGHMDPMVVYDKEGISYVIQK
jgi:hypothetical protein